MLSHPITVLNVSGGVSVVLASQRQTWISRAKVYSRSLKSDKPKNAKIEQSEKQLFLKRIA